MSTRTFKALSIVTNVKQGELVKRLIEENEKLKEKNKEMKKELGHRRDISGVLFECDVCGNDYYTTHWDDCNLGQYPGGHHYIKFDDGTEEGLDINQPNFRCLPCNREWLNE